MDRRPKPTDEERRALVNWITGELKRKKEAKTTIAGKALLRRMNRDEYQKTMTDLLGIEFNFAENLPPDSISKDGFKNNGMSLGMSPIQMEYYLKAARDALAEVIVEGEQPEAHQIALDPAHRKGKLNLGRAVRFQQDQAGLVLQIILFFLFHNRFSVENQTKSRSFHFFCFFTDFFLPKAYFRSEVYTYIIL